jgi:ectoine hydroxylase-related dioxygenase (phytanoyl-CoA dioxygenase family)
VQPPDGVLQQLLAVRVHIDDCGVENGPLRVVPGSHVHGRIASSSVGRLRDAVGEVPCLVKRGGALLFKPLVLHASSKAVSPRHRRVLHFLFGPSAIGYGLRWQHAV